MIGSVVVSEKKALGDLPAYVTIGGLAPKAGYLGQKCEAYFVGRPGRFLPITRSSLPIGALPWVG